MKIVDLDTDAFLKCAKENPPLFHKPLEESKVPILFIGSKEDESCRNNMEEEYREMASMIPQSEIHLFQKLYPFRKLIKKSIAKSCCNRLFSSS